MSESFSIEPQAYPTVSSEMLHAYALASGDSNPIHLNEEVAKQSGLPGRIAHGMLIAGWVTDRAARFCELHPLTVRGFWFRDLQFRFKAMTLMGDKITIAGTAQADPQESQALKLELNATNQRGEVTVQAQLTVVSGDIPVLLASGT